jgi:hypothetical protein
MTHQLDVVLCYFFPNIYIRKENKTKAKMEEGSRVVEPSQPSLKAEG